MVFKGSTTSAEVSQSHGVRSSKLPRTPRLIREEVMIFLVIGSWLRVWRHSAAQSSLECCTHDPTRDVHSHHHHITSTFHQSKFAPIFPNQLNAAASGLLCELLLDDRRREFPSPISACRLQSKADQPGRLGVSMQVPRPTTESL